MYFRNLLATTLHKLWVLWYVLKACKCLIWRALKHDWSKYGRYEEPFFRVYSPKLKTCTYGSDQYKQFLAELKPAIDHHYSVNDHHPEVHESFEVMPLLAKLEMLCDWKAATRRHADGCIRRSIEGNAARFGYDEHMMNM